MPQQEKWIGRSRRWQAAAITMLTGLVGFGVIPEGAIGPIRAFLDTITGDSGVLAAGFQAYAGLALAWSYFRPDNAKAKILPKAGLKGVDVAALVIVAGLGFSVFLLSGCASDFGKAAFMRGDAMREHILCKGDCKVSIGDNGQSVVQTTGVASEVTYRYTAGGKMSAEARALAAQVLYIGQQVGAAQAGIPPGMVKPPPPVPAPTLTADQVRVIVAEQLEAFTAPAGDDPLDLDLEDD